MHITMISRQIGASHPFRPPVADEIGIVAVVDIVIRHTERERVDGSYLRTFALELREQLAQTLAVFVTSILAKPRSRLDAEEAAQPPLRQIVEMLQQVMCTDDAEKLAISVLEIYEASKP